MLVSWDINGIYNIYNQHDDIYICVSAVFGGLKIKKKNLLGIFLRNNGEINRTELNHLIWYVCLSENEVPQEMAIEK